MWGNDLLLQRLGVRLIAVDRPGVGSSSFQPKRHLSDWPADIIALADGLGLSRFSVLGYSGGGPYAAVCASKIPERLIHAGMVSSLAPFDLPGMLTGVTPGNVQFLKLSHQKPWLYRILYRQLSLMGRYAPQQYLKRALPTFDVADRSVFARPEVHGALFAISGASRGQQVDTALIIGEWDFDLTGIAIPVQLWYGDQDRNASMAMYRYLAVTIPQTRSHLLPGEGHISLIVNYAETILQALI